MRAAILPEFHFFRKFRILFFLIPFSMQPDFHFFRGKKRSWARAGRILAHFSDAKN
jgi:hypothetical protein